MRVGLYDYDLNSDCSNGISLDLLKLAGDYRNKNDICSLIPNLSNIDLYTKIHFWSDVNNNLNNLPKEITSDKIEVGGLSFGVKIPKDIEDIRYTTDLYKKWFEKNASNKKIVENKIKSILKASHIRLERDNVILNYKKHIVNRLLILYDTDIFKINNWEDIFDDIVSFVGKPVFGFKYPIIIDSMEKNSKINKYQISAMFGTRYFDLNSSKDDFLNFLNTYKGNYRKNAFVIAPRRFDTNHEKILYVKKILSRVIFCQSNLKVFSLVYKDNNFFNGEFRYFLMLLLEWRKYTIMCMKERKKISFMNYLTGTMNIDWFSINYIFELDPDIKKLCILNPTKKLSQEILYESA